MFTNSGIARVNIHVMQRGQKKWRCSGLRTPPMIAECRELQGHEDYRVRELNR